jgi:hypothetical protein
MDAKQAPAAQVAATAKIYVSPGVKSILQAGVTENPRRELPALERGPDYWPLIRALLVATDLLLLALCGLLVWRASGAMTVWEALGCIVAVATGAALTCASILVSTESLPLHYQPSGNGRVSDSQCKALFSRSNVP